MTEPVLFLPRPWQVTSGEGEFSLNAGTIIQVDGSPGERTLDTARHLQTEVSRMAGLRPAITPVLGPPRAGAISLRVDPAARSGRDDAVAGVTGAQEYRLDVAPGGVSLVAGGEPGLFYGVQALLQLAQQTGRRWPALTIVDRPALPHRGLMLDVSRGKVPTLDTLKDLVRLLARFRYTQLQLYTEHTFDFPSHPGIGAGVDALTANDILELDAVCRRHHIELVPNLQSIGHHTVMLNLPQFRHLAETSWNWSMATASDEGFSILADLYDDLLPTFSSRLFNINGDEPWDLGRGQSRHLTEEMGVGRLYLEHVKRIHQLVTERGHEMMMWADMFWHHPELIDEFPADIILLDWWYEKKDRHDSVDVIARAGRRFYVCPGTSSWLALYPRLDNAIANVRTFVRDGIAAGCEGMLMTDWGDQGHFQPYSNSWYAYLWAAESAWSGGRVDSDEFDAAFGRVFLDDPTGRQVAAIRRLGAATQSDADWHHTWHTAMALWEDPVAGRQHQRTPPSITTEARVAAREVLDVTVEAHNDTLRHDLGFAAALIDFAASKVETTRAIHQALADLADEVDDDPDDAGISRLDALLRRLEADRATAAALMTEFRQRWLAEARWSQIEINLDRWRGLLDRYDEAIRWLGDQAVIYADGRELDVELINYDLGGYAVLHDARYREIMELVEIIGFEELPPDLQRYVTSHVP